MVGPAIKREPGAGGSAQNADEVRGMARGVGAAVPDGQQAPPAPGAAGDGGRRRRLIATATPTFACLPQDGDMPQAVEAFLLMGRVVQRTKAGQVQRGVVKHFRLTQGSDLDQPLGARAPQPRRRRRRAPLNC